MVTDTSGSTLYADTLFGPFEVNFEWTGSPVTFWFDVVQDFDNGMVSPSQDWGNCQMDGNATWEITPSAGTGIDVWSEDDADITFNNPGSWVVTATHPGWSCENGDCGDSVSPKTATVNVNILDCCQEAINDLNWDNTTTLNQLCYYQIGDCVTTGMCYTANSIAGDAQEFANQHYKNDPNKHNAAQHAYWALTMAEDMNSCASKQITDAYEVDEVNPCAETYKDVWNNKVGRDLANQSGTKYERINNAINSGLLRLEAGC